MSSFNKILTGLKVKKSWIPKIKRQKRNKGTISSTELTEPEEILHQENQERLYSIKTPASITNLPTEIYLQIFGYLLFTDLYVLSSVSKFFRDLLWSKSEFTQSIWRNCRLLHYPKYPKLPPPDGMCEQQYIWITLAKKTCQFCKGTYEKSGFDKWLVKINVCDSCMSSDEHIIDVVGEFSVKNSMPFPREFKGCIPYTEYIGYFNENHHKYYFVEDVEKIKNEYSSLAEEEKQGWVENKRKELRDYLGKVKDYQMQDRAHYWSQFTYSRPEGEYEENEDEEDEDEDIGDIDQDYDQEDYYNQDYVIRNYLTYATYLDGGDDDDLVDNDDDDLVDNGGDDDDLYDEEISS